MKVKKDYLYNGAMADSADLVVLGAWYGTGNKGSLFDLSMLLRMHIFFYLIHFSRFLGGMMSIFLMGCYDEDHDNWVTVTKVRN